MIRDDFCVLILSHGRAESVKTVRMLERLGYTGKYYVVIDDEDKTAEKYHRVFGEKVLVFSKKKWVEETDDGDNTGKTKAVVYARNAAFDIAKSVGCKYFLVLDDDYTIFSIRFDSKCDPVTNVLMVPIDDVFSATIEFFEKTNFKTIAYAQGGDYIGGPAEAGIMLKRKAMNTFFCSTERPFKFFGKINEDVNAYVLLGRRGELFGTITQAYIVQMTTQKNKGGLTDIYLDLGTYVKSFYSVMYAPSCVKIGVMGDAGKHGETSAHYRIHHKINWGKTAPKIIREEWKKQ